MPTRSRISPFYRLYLPTVDPLIALAGIITNLFAQPTILNSYNVAFPANSKHVPIETAVCMDTIAGHLLGTFFLQVVLLRARPDDLTVWRWVQFSILVVDVFMLGALGKALNAQGRLNWGKLRVEELVNIAITGSVALIRVVFLMGFGVKTEGKAKEY